MDPAHPLRVALGQVVVDGDDVHAPAAEAVQVDGQGGHEGLALAGLHLRDPAEVQGGPAHELDVVVALADDPPGRLPGDGEGLEEQVVQGVVDGSSALGDPVELLAELDRLVRRSASERASISRLEGVDVGHQRGERLELLALAGAEDLGQDRHGAESTGGRLGAGWSGCGRRAPRPGQNGPWRGRKTRSAEGAGGPRRARSTRAPTPRRVSRRPPASRPSTTNRRMGRRSRSKIAPAAGWVASITTRPVPGRTIPGRTTPVPGDRPATRPTTAA